MIKSDTTINIVVIDNEETSAEELETILNLHDFNLHTVQSIDECNNSIHLYNPEAIVISSSLSLEDGIGICKKIRAESNIPILVLSNSKKIEVLKKTLEAGADEFLTKPVSSNVLIAHLNTLVRRAREEKLARKKLLG